MLLTQLCIYSYISIISFVTAKDNAWKREDPDVLRYIDPLIGSRSGGNVFSGATLPYGMAKGTQVCLMMLLECS